MKTDTKHQHAIKLVFTSSRELTNDEIEHLIGRLLLEIEEPAATDEDGFSCDADFSTENAQHAYENLTLVPTDERIVGSINQFPAR